MADLFNTVWAALEPLVQTTWPDCTVLFRASQSRRINFRQLIEDGDLTAPFAVVQPMPALPSDQGPANARCWTLPVAFYYVRPGWLSQTADVTAYAIVERQCEAKAKAMADALLDYSAGEFQLFTEPAVDASETNPANALFAENGTNLWAGMASADLLVGESA